MSDTLTPISYQQATDEQVIAGYEAACAVEVEIHGMNDPREALIASVCEEWMREGMKRGLI